MSRSLNLVRQHLEQDHNTKVAQSSVARNLIGGRGVHVLTSHCNFKTCVNVPHVNKTVTDFFGGEGSIFTDIDVICAMGGPRRTNHIYRKTSDRSRAPHAGRGSDSLVLIEAGPRLQARSRILAEELVKRRCFSVKINKILVPGNMKVDDFCE